MIKYKIYYNKTYKNTSNLVIEEKKGHYLVITLNGVLIDGLGVAKKEEIHSIQFTVNGYTQVIAVTPNGKIEATDIEYPEHLK